MGRFEILQGFRDKGSRCTRIQFVVGCCSTTHNEALTNVLRVTSPNSELLLQQWLPDRAGLFLWEPNPHNAKPKA